MPPSRCQDEEGKWSLHLKSKLASGAGEGQATLQVGTPHPRASEPGNRLSRRPRPVLSRARKPTFVICDLGTSQPVPSASVPCSARLDSLPIQASAPANPKGSGMAAIDS